jgi:uncharacterized Fe-S cluster-containing radical SAM superfamily enzyme
MFLTDGMFVTIRYVDKEKNIKENFLSFRDVSADTSGESLSKELLTFIDEAGLDRRILSPMIEITSFCVVLVVY